MVFIWIFLPMVLVGNFVMQKVGGNRAANVLLVVVSIFFYAWGEPVYVLLMLASILLNWGAGLLIDRCELAQEGERGKCAKFLLVVTIVLNLGFLGYFKYAGMLVETINTICGTTFSNPQISLPIGISFYTFQALSYVIDVYRGKCEVQHNAMKMALYVSFFPQLIAGPIVQYKDVAEQIDHRTLSASQTVEGIRRFCYGLGKKVLISNTMASASDAIYALDFHAVTTSMAWIASIFYTMQIYYDFSGYSDMAIGLGKMFGFEFRENFNYPYISTSIREFWRRWHISLSLWFREYVYIPLGGNRKGTARTYLNLFIVFLLTGLWHGASWNFVLWGLYHGVLLIIERLGMGKWLEKHRGIAWIYTFLMVNFGWVLFRIENIATALRYILRMIRPWKYMHTGYSIMEFIDFRALFFLLCAVVGMGALQRFIKRKEGSRASWPEMAYCFVLLALSCMSLASNSYNPFIYFRF